MARREVARVYLWQKNYGQYRRTMAGRVIRSDKSDVGGPGLRHMLQFVGVAPGNAMPESTQVTALSVILVFVFFLRFVSRTRRRCRGFRSQQ